MAIWTIFQPFKQQYLSRYPDIHPLFLSSKRSEQGWKFSTRSPPSTYAYMTERRLAYSSSQLRPTNLEIMQIPPSPASNRMIHWEISNQHPILPLLSSVVSRTYEFNCHLRANERPPFYFRMILSP